jgi:elongation of very long chain fatty acids protein 6
MTVSKLYELGDTAFVILRKQPLMFLHWYHHVTVFIYAWYSYTDQTSTVRWFVVMNFSVHALMYSYYTMRALKFRLPKIVNIFITSMQIAQMGMGLLVLSKAYQYKSQGHFCQQTWNNMRCGGIMYLSYFVLFAHFFYSTYIKPKSSKSAEKVGTITNVSDMLDEHHLNANKKLNINIMNGNSKKLD